MSEKKYSLQEIDRMRHALQYLTTPIGHTNRQEEMDKMIEDRLRTYMQNGTDPEELEKAKDELFRLRLRTHSSK